jgi:hypothetical protein
LPSNLFYEKSDDSFPKLVKEIGLLDLDSGIRTFGDYKGKKRFVFVTRSPHDGYILMVYSKKAGAGTPVPGERLLVKEFQTKESLSEFMRGMLSKPLRAFVY